MTLPSNPNDRKKLRAMLVEITNSMALMEAEREQKKSITDRIKEEFGIKPAVANKLARTMYKQNYNDVAEEIGEFELLYESVVEGRTAPGDEAADAPDED